MQHERIGIWGGEPRSVTGRLGRGRWRHQAVLSTWSVFWPRQPLGHITPERLPPQSVLG